VHCPEAAVVVAVLIVVALGVVVLVVVLLAGVVVVDDVAAGSAVVVVVLAPTLTWLLLVPHPARAAAKPRAASAIGYLRRRAGTWFSWEGELCPIGRSHPLSGSTAMPLRCRP
jgi:hypothetical protein